MTCSCSHHVSEAMLLEVVAQASLDAGRQLRVLERRTQAQDHPILLTVPETMYLKCLVNLQVPGLTARLGDRTALQSRDREAVLNSPSAFQEPSPIHPAESTSPAGN